MFGTVEKQFCSGCKKDHDVELGSVDIYEDVNGTFNYTGTRCDCGHIIYSERLLNAKKIGIACY